VIAAAFGGGCQADTADGGIGTASASTAQSAAPGGADVTAGAVAAVDAPQASPMMSLETTEEFAALVAAVSGARAEASEAQFAAQSTRQEQREAMVAACMKQQGFEYVPVPYKLMTSSAVTDFWQHIDSISVPTLPLSRADVERFGYGVQEPLPASVLAPLSQEEQANAAYVAQLSADAQAAYDLALTGHDAVVPATYEEAGGCRGEALATFPDPAAASQQQIVLDNHEDFIHDFRWLIIDGVVLDARMVAANRDWAKCMASAGIDHLVGWEDQVTPYSALMLALRTDSDGVLWEPASSGEAEEPEQYRSLAMSPPEVTIALADFDCRAEVGYHQTANQIALELQRSFINENRRQADELLAALAAATD
jgi:hypothetical protein